MAKGAGKISCVFFSAFSCAIMCYMNKRGRDGTGIPGIGDGKG